MGPQSFIVKIPIQKIDILKQQEINQIWFL